MAGLPFVNADLRLPPNNFSTRTTRNPLVPPYPAPRFADFQFRTIGQQPELLKRISAPNPDTQYEHDSDRPSPSSSLSPYQSPPLSGSDTAKRPSLQDRLSLSESPAAETDAVVDVTMADALEIRPAIETRSTLSITTSETQVHRRHGDASSDSPPVVSEAARRSEKEPGLSQDTIYTAQAIAAATEKRVTSASDESGFPIITSSPGTQTRLSPPLVQISTQANGTSTAPASFFSAEDLHSLAALRTLQSRLSSSLSNFNPISTANALTTAQSAKDQCTEILAAAHRSHTLAQQASLLAHDSMVAAQDCLNAAATIQNRADLALSAVEKIRSNQAVGSRGEWEHNATVKALKDDLYELAEWIRQRDAYESKCLRQFEEDKIGERKKILACQPQPEPNKSSAYKQSHDVNMYNKLSGAQISIHKAGPTTVEDEADAAAQAWNQHREQSAERKRLAEDELRKHREAELELERQRLHAQAEVDAREAELEKLRAARLKAEEEEKSRQEKETLELQRQQQELEIVRFLRSQKQAQDNLAKAAAEEKQKAQAAEAEKEARLIAEHEQKRRELHEKEVLRRQEIEKAKVLLAENETKRRENVISERMKRLSVEVQNPPASSQTVANILDKAKKKQSMAILTTDSHIPSQHVPLPSTPTRKASAISSPNHAEFGNVVSKRNLLSNSPRNSKQQNRTLPSNIKLDKSSSNAIDLMSSISSIPKSSTSMQEGPDLTSTIPSSIDEPLLSDNFTLGMSSSHIHEFDRESILPLTSPPPLSPLIPLTDENSSCPVSVAPAQIRNSSTSNGFEDIHAEMISGGPDVGNLSVAPLSRILPVSAEAQRANLRPYMNANGISYGPGAHNDAEQKPFLNTTDQPSVATERSRRASLSSPQTNGGQVGRPPSASKPASVEKPKLEPLNDVPILSIPSPTAATPFVIPPAKPKPKLPDFKKIKRVPSMTTPETPLQPKEFSTSPQSIALPPEAAADDLSLPNSPTVSKEKVRPAAVRRNVPPLTKGEQSLADTINRASQANDQHLSASPRMGPDAAVTDGWTQPVTMADDLMAKKPEKHLSRNGLDHFSPPPHAPSMSSQSCLPPVRPRPLHSRNDHYSPPRRTADPPSSHNDYRRQSGSVEYARGFSPPPKYNENRRTSSPEDMPIIGRKRYRNDDSDVARPPRRYRYASPPFRQDEYAQSKSSYQQPDVDWNRTENYGRSPSPEPRMTPLALRLESEKPSQGGSSYRPTYNNSDSYVYDPPSRNNKNHRYSGHHSQPIPQGSNYYGDASSQQRQYVRNDIMDDAHLPLLSRFTDSAGFNNHHGPARPRSMRGHRGSGNPALEHRISKPKSVSLINRLEDAN